MIIVIHSIIYSPFISQISNTFPMVFIIPPTGTGEELWQHGHQSLFLCCTQTLDLSRQHAELKTAVKTRHFKVACSLYNILSTHCCFYLPSITLGPHHNWIYFLSFVFRTFYFCTAVYCTFLSFFLLLLLLLLLTYINL